MRDSTVEATSPAINDSANPWKIGSNKITLAPTTTAAAVKSMGRKRTAPASATASSSDIPCDRRSSMKSTRMMEFRTMMPAPAMKPIIEVAVKKAPINACAGVLLNAIAIGQLNLVDGVAHLENGVNRTFHDTCNVPGHVDHRPEIFAV